MSDHTDSLDCLEGAVMPLSLTDVRRFPLGSRVRFTQDTTTVAGIVFRGGEEATVVQHRLASLPGGDVLIVDVATEDGRRFFSGFGSMWEPVATRPSRGRS